MKKNWTQLKYKKAHLVKSKKRFKRKLNHRDYLRKKGKSYLFLSYFQRQKIYQQNYEHRTFVKIRAPKNFSFIDNVEEVSNFISKLSFQFKSKNKVFVILDHVESVTHDAVIVLLSIMVKFKSERIGFNGSFPDSFEARKIITQSGFFENLYKSFKNEDRYSIEPKTNRIHTHAWKDVDSELGDKIIKDATKTIWGEERRCQGVQRALIELMQNTNNHAKIDSEGEKHWWLSVNHIKEESKVCFSFVDFGVGVFKSLDKKKSKSKWFGWKAKLAKHFNYSSNVELFKLILEGKLHKTVTNHHFRGKGLPGIKLVMDRNQISNLHIITNDVFSNISQNNYHIIKKSFSGTFVYWELTKNNINCHA